MENKVNFSVEYFSSVESEVLVVRVPKDGINPSSGIETKVFSSCEELADYLRSL